MKQMTFIKISNKLFDFDLKASAFKVYVYLSGVFFWTHKVTIKLETIAENCNIGTNTAQRAVNELTAKGLIYKTEYYKGHRRVTNEYTIKRLDGGFVMIDKNIIKADLDKSSFMILCYIYMRANKSYKSYPSLSSIVSGTGIGRTTVIAKVKPCKSLGIYIKNDT